LSLSARDLALCRIINESVVDETEIDDELVIVFFISSYDGVVKGLIRILANFERLFYELSVVSIVEYFFRLFFENGSIYNKRIILG